MRNFQHVLKGAISWGLLVAASVALVSGCRGGQGDLVSANESPSTAHIAASGFASGAGPWTPPDKCMGGYFEITANNGFATLPVQLVIRAGSTGTSQDQILYSFALGSEEQQVTSVLLRFTSISGSFKAWQDGTVGTFDLTGVYLTVQPSYWLVDMGP